MTEIDNIAATLTRITRQLSALNLTFHYTGGLVVSFYGEPRFTRDIDIVVRLSGQPDETRRLIASLVTDYIIAPESIEQAIRSEDMFQAIDKDTCYKIDFYVGEAIPGELDRRIFEEILPGLVVPIVSKEDAILSKLIWVKKGSERSRQDIVTMLQGEDPIDWPVLTERARHLSVIDLLEQIQVEGAH